MRAYQPLLTPFSCDGPPFPIAICYETSTPDAHLSSSMWKKRLSLLPHSPQGQASRVCVIERQPSVPD
jgi:hypothetical protein